MGWTCNIHDRDEKHKIHGTKQNKKANLGDPVVDGIKLTLRLPD